MANNSTEPFQRRIPLLADIVPEAPSEYGPLLWQTEDSLPAIVDDTDTAWSKLGPTLYDIVHEESTAFGFEAPTRVELVWDRDPRPALLGDQDIRGLALFDSNGRLFVHVVHALVGYDGSGPTLSRDILRLIGVPYSVFNEIQAATAHRSYAIILERHEATGKWRWSEGSLTSIKTHLIKQPVGS